MLTLKEEIQYSYIPLNIQQAIFVRKQSVDKIDYYINKMQELSGLSSWQEIFTIFSRLFSLDLVNNVRDYYKYQQMLANIFSLWSLNLTKMEANLNQYYAEPLISTPIADTPVPPILNSAAQDLWFSAPDFLKTCCGAKNSVATPERISPHNRPSPQNH